MRVLIDTLSMGRSLSPSQLDPISSISWSWNTTLPGVTTKFLPTLNASLSSNQVFTLLLADGFDERFPGYH